MLTSVEPSKLVRTVKSTAQARPAAIQARGVPATTHPQSSPLVDLSSSRRSRATSWSIGSPQHCGIKPHSEIVLRETITRISQPADLTPDVDSFLIWRKFVGNAVSEVGTLVPTKS